MENPQNDVLALLAERISTTEEASPDLDDLLEELVSGMPGLKQGPEKQADVCPARNAAVVFVEGVSIPQGHALATLEEVADAKDTLYLCGPDGSLLNLSRLR